MTAHLARGSVLVWAVAIACVGVLFSAMGTGVIEQSREDDVGGFLGSQLGAQDPVAATSRSTGTVVGLLICSYAVLYVLKTRHQEISGRTDHVLAAVRTPVGAAHLAAGVTTVASLAVLFGAGALSSLTGSQVVGGSSAPSGMSRTSPPRALQSSACSPRSQWPGAPQ